MKKISTLILASSIAICAASAATNSTADVQLFKDKKNVEFTMQKNIGEGMFMWVGGIAINPEDDLVAAGHQKVLVFSPDGKKVAEFPTEFTAASCCTDSTGNIYIGSRATKSQPSSIYKYSPKGKLLKTWNKTDGESTILTATGMESHGKFVYVSDTRLQCIHKFDLDGKFVGTIGKKRDFEKKSRGEFSTCCGILDFGISPKDGSIHIANLGRHNVTWTNNEGESFEAWGKRGSEVEDFCGCCNPTNLTVTQNGYIVTAEKTIPRIKVYTPDGKKMLAIMGTDIFDRSCGNLDIAVDSKCNIYAIDSKKRCIRKFSPASPQK